MGWCAGVALSDRAAVGSKPGGLDGWVGELVGRWASDVLDGSWNRRDPVVQATSCGGSAGPDGDGMLLAGLGAYPRAMVRVGWGGCRFVVFGAAVARLRGRWQAMGECSRTSRRRGESQDELR